jgi:protein involved in polysaccharide export with SLBB domain
MTRTHLSPYPTRGGSRAARVFWTVVLLPVACWAGGCVGTGQPVSDGIPVRRLPAEILGRSKSDLQPTPLPLLRHQEPDAYRVDRGDVLTVFAEDVLGVRDKIPVQTNPNPTAAKPATQGYPVTVQDDGTIQIPEIPPLQVRGMTINEVRAAIVKAITIDKKLIVVGKERVSVDLLQPRRYRVLVVREDCPPTPGDVAACGDGKNGSGHVLMLEAYHNDLLEALNRTGGLPGPCAKNEVVIRRGSGRDGAADVVRIPLRLALGDPITFTDTDIILHDGDTVHVEARGDESYTVVGGPGCGQFTLPRDTDLRIIEALAKATCPTPDCGAVTVMRSVGCRRQVAIRVDLHEALRDPRENILILPGDVIVLPGCGPCNDHGCALNRSCAKRFQLPGWFSPIGPRAWPIGGSVPCADGP